MLRPRRKHEEFRQSRSLRRAGSNPRLRSELAIAFSRKGLWQSWLERSEAVPAGKSRCFFFLLRQKIFSQSVLPRAGPGKSLNVQECPVLVTWKAQGPNR